MKNIAVLDESTIDKIAAGEVIERPSSVVKELVENAIDAGATAVTAEIKDGGISLIRITDNGEGIAKDQISTAFLRHATSKITKVEFLLRLRFLFFQPFLQCILQLLHGRIILIRIDGHAFFHDLINLLRSRTCGCGYPERYLPLPVFHPGIPLSADYPGSFP